MHGFDYEYVGGRVRGGVCLTANTDLPYKCPPAGPPTSTRHHLVCEVCATGRLSAAGLPATHACMHARMRGPYTARNLCSAIFMLHGKKCSPSYLAEVPPGNATWQSRQVAFPP